MRLLTILAICLSFVANIKAQNAAPSFSNVNLNHDAANRKINLTFDLTDTEKDTLTVVLQISNDGNKYLPATNITGDVGNQIYIGAGKQISWTYDDGTDLSKIKLKIVAYDKHTPSIAEMVAKVSADSLRANLEAIVGVRHYQAAPEKLTEVENYIHSKMISAGLTTRHQEFLFNNTFFNNMIGHQEGLNNNELCLINGHFDSADDAPGADDNGTGVVGVLEAMRVLNGYFFENNIQYTNFNLEELGLIGSNKYVNGGIKAGENIVGLLNYEMIGYYSDQPNSQTVPNGFELLFPAAVTQIINNQNRGDFIINCGNATSSALNTTFFQAAAQYVPELKVINLVVPGNGQIASDLRRSDHAPFWDKGYKALMLTDGAETRNQNYHTPNDVIGTINFEFLSNVAAAGIATLATIAKPINATKEVLDLSLILNNKSSDKETFNLEINPNPVVNEIKFSIDNKLNIKDLKITISDSMGRTVLNNKLSVVNKSEFSLDVRSLLPGNYFLNLSSGHISQSKRFNIIK